MTGYLHAVAVIAFALLVSTPALAATSGKEAGRSASRVTLKLAASGEQRSFECLAAAFQELYKDHEPGFHSTQVLDYSTFGKQEKLIDAERAYFLVNAKNVKDPCDFKVVAFADRKAAVAAQKKIGGDLRDFDDAWEAVALHWGVELNPQPRASVAAPASQPRRSPPPADCFT